MEKNFESNIFKSVLEQLNITPLSADTWIDSLKEILNNAIKIFKGGVTYGIYSINNQTIRLEIGGPNNEAHYINRKNLGERNISEGLIGKTIRNKQPYTIYNNVEDPDVRSDYLSGNSETKSELVVVIYNFSSSQISNQPLGIINLEANKDNIFNHTHGLLFSMIANWSGQLHARNEATKQTHEILNCISSLPSELQRIKSNYERRKTILLRLGNISQYITNSNVFAIALHDEKSYGYKILCHKSYPKELRELKGGDQEKSIPASIFRAHQTGIKTRGKPTIHRYGQDKLAPGFVESSIEDLKYFESICFDYEFENTRKIAALILGFNKDSPVETNTDNVRFLATIMAGLINQFEKIDDAESLMPVTESFVRLSKNNKKTKKDIFSYLDSTAKHLTNILNSTGAIFYELINEESESRITLNSLGSHIIDRSPLDWRDIFQDSPANMKKFQKLEAGEGEDDYSEFMIVVNSKQDSSRIDKYNIYAKCIKLHKKIIFVSLKKLENYHEILTLSETKRIILNSNLSLISSFVQNWLRENSVEYSLEGFRKVVGIWFQQIVEQNPQPNNKNLLFTAVHEFLRDWNPIAGTPYSAIFLISETTLEMTDASMTHLGAANLGLSKLKFNIANNINKEEKIGLTRKVWNERKSILSFSIQADGNDECRNFWQQIVINSANERFFAGVVIGNEESPRGVITINGTKPIFDVQKLSMEPSILPMLEIIAEELGKQIQNIENIVNY
jgi:putative methionine-R-sulfoxide reductase with GAF domain